jgi:hypothetical protein
VLPVIVGAPGSCVSVGDGVVVGPVTAGALLPPPPHAVRSKEASSGASDSRHFVIVKLLFNQLFPFFAAVIYGCVPLFHYRAGQKNFMRVSK